MVTVLFPSPRGVGVILAKQEKRLIKFFAWLKISKLTVFYFNGEYLYSKFQ